MTEIKIATDENGLADCGCGANRLYWSAKEDYLSHEADHSLAGATEIAASALPWNRRDKNEEPLQRLFRADYGPSDWDGWVEREKERAEQNGLSAHCSECYGSMSPTMVTHEMKDAIQRE